MVPRPDMVAVDINSDIDDVVEVALQSGHRRLPVFAESLENIIGVVRLRDLIEAQRNNIHLLKGVMSPVHVVPESLRVTTLLSEMQERSDHLAIVVDEYGVTVGLVTVEDVAEELLGTMSPDQPPNQLESVEVGHWVSPGALPVEDLEAIGVDVPAGEWNTVAGLMLGQAGRLLSTGESVHIPPFVLRVDAVRGRRIIRVSIRNEEDV